MAGDWIKMRSNLWDDPRVARLCDITGAGEAAIVGGLYWLWACADQHSEDGAMPGLTLRSIDRKTGIKGFGDALLSIEWIADYQEGVRIVRFEEHNGKSAKRRCSESVRKMSARDADKLHQLSDDLRTACAPRERVREREESKPKTLEPSALVASKLPTCPQKEIIAMFAEELPDLPQPRVWDGVREKSLRSRWLWVLSDLKAKGKPCTDTDGIAFFRRMFAYIRRSDFLMGRSGNWSCPGLHWVVEARNFAKIIEGAYENKEAA